MLGALLVIYQQRAVTLEFVVCRMHQCIGEEENAEEEHNTGKDPPGCWFRN